MGWTYGFSEYKTVKSFAEDYLVQNIKNRATKNPDGWQYVDHSLASNDDGEHELYVLIKKGDQVTIAFFLIEKDQDGSFGYKDFDENMGHNWFECPLKFLKQSTQMGEYAVNWRNKVEEHQQSKKERTARVKSLKAGDKLELDCYGSGYTVTFLREHQSRGHFVGQEDNGAVYKFKYSMISKFLSGNLPPSEKAA